MDVKLYLADKILKKIALKIKAEEILAVVTDHWQKAIDNQIPPTLKPKTISLKQSKNYLKPETPLYATGGLYNGLVLGEVTDTSIRIEYNSKVNPAWHRTDHRAKGVSKRDPLSDRSELFKKINEVLRGG